MKYIQVMTIPGKSVPVEVDKDATLGVCVETAGMVLNGFDITVAPNAIRGANANSAIPDGSTICLTKQAKGA